MLFINNSLKNMNYWAQTVNVNMNSEPQMRLYLVIDGQWHLLFLGSQSTYIWLILLEKCFRTYGMEICIDFSISAIFWNFLKFTLVFSSKHQPTPYKQSTELSITLLQFQNTFFLRIVSFILSCAGGMCSDENELSRIEKI